MRWLMLLMLLGCNSTPPTKAEAKKNKFWTCINSCESEHLSAVWIKGWKSDIAKPVELRKCIQQCELK